MIKCEVIEEFDLKDFAKLKNIQRKNKAKDTNGRLYVEDTFECDEEMAKYLLGDNILKKTVVKVIEVAPKKEEAKQELDKVFDDIGEILDKKIKVVEVKPKKKKK